MEKLRVGFIGAGFISRFQIQALRWVRNVELTAVCSRSIESARSLAEYARQQEVGDCQAYATVAEVCRNCDAVAVFAPNFARVEHMEQIAEAVKAGAPLKGIICEKPLARTVAEARRVVELVKSTGLPTAYLENQLHMKCVRNAISQLTPQQMAMGPMSIVRTSEEHAGPHNPWFWDPTRQGGGALSDLACHSIAVAWYLLTPVGKPVTFLEPVSVMAETSLLKWGQPGPRQDLLNRMGVDYSKTPAEDFCTGLITFRNPETGQRVQGQFTTSWMYDKQGLRIYMDGMGPGYAFEINSLKSPLEVFVGDAAASAVANAETAIEKATASRGLIPVQPNEADLFGYVDELVDVRHAFLEGRDAFLGVEYGLEITRLCQAAYLSAEERRTVDLTDPATNHRLETYTSLIAQGRGLEVFNR